MDRPRAAISWSGGKDGCAALQRGRCDFDVVAMVTARHSRNQNAAL
jgi:diphthamide synthase (EF-2-diphthine--ammonia ligase)